MEQSKCVVGKKYGESEKQSILQNTLIVAEMEQPKHLTQSEYDLLDFTDKED